MPELLELRLVEKEVGERNPRKSTPEQMMLKTIEDQIVDLFGPKAGKALIHNVEPSVAPFDPVKYEADLRSMLGPMSKIVLSRIRSGFCELAGKKPTASCEGIEGCLQCIIQNSVD